MNHGVPFGFLSQELPRPVMRWKMDEGAGISLADSTGNGYTGTLSGAAVSWSSGAVGGKTVNFLVFGGVSGMASAVSGVTQIGSVSNASMSAWILVTASTNNMAIGALPALAVATSWFGVMQTGSKTYALICPPNSANFPNCGPLSANVWHFFTVTFDGTQVVAANRVKMYIDGVSQSLTPNGSGNPALLGTAAQVGPQMVGVNPNNAFFGNQSTTDFQIFNVTLNQNQITALMERGPQT